MGIDVTHSAVQTGAGHRQREALTIRYITDGYGLNMLLNINSTQVDPCAQSLTNGNPVDSCVGLHVVQPNRLLHSERVTPLAWSMPPGKAGSAFLPASGQYTSHGNPNPRQKKLRVWRSLIVLLREMRPVQGSWKIATGEGAGCMARMSLEYCSISASTCSSSSRACSWRAFWKPAYSRPPGRMAARMASLPSK
jgi:hypothetical protein